MKKKHSISDIVCMCCIAMSLGYAYITGTSDEKVYLLHILLNMATAMFFVAGILLLIYGIARLLNNLLSKRIKEMDEEE